MIGALVALISLEMTRRLVAAGTVAKSLAIIGATNTTPVVITTSSAHGYTRPAHAVVSGVGGNAGANGLWVMTPVDGQPAKLSLSKYDSAGTPVDSVGTGSYTSGGTAQVAFPDGSILLGRRNIAMATAVATPRIVFVLATSGAWPLTPDPYGGVIPPAALPTARASQTAEQQTMLQRRQLYTEPTTFDVYVTGCANPPSPDFGDFDVTQSLYHLLAGVLFDIVTPDRARILGGTWASQRTDVQVLQSRGQQWVGRIEIKQPVTDAPLAFVPVPISGTLDVNFQDGASGDQTLIVVS